MKEIEYVARKGVLIKVKDEHEVKEIRFSDIKPFWQYATESYFEGGNALLLDNIVVFSIIVASGQGEVIVGWDLEQDKVIHISNADYCIDFAIYKDMLYMLFDVNNYTTPSNISVYRIPFGTMDANNVGTKLCSENSINIHGELKIEVNESGIFIVSNNSRITFASSPENALISPGSDAENS